MNPPKLLKLPELVKLEAHATLPLSDLYNLLSLGNKNDQLANAYSMRLVEMKDQLLTNACSMTMRLVEMKDQLINTCCATKRLVEMMDQLTIPCCATKRLVEMEDQLTIPCLTTMRLVEMKDQLLTNAYCMTMKMSNQLTDACHAAMRLVEMTGHLKRYDLQNVSYIVKTTVDTTDGGLQQVTPGSTVMNSFMRQSAIMTTTEFGSEAKVFNSDLDLSHLMQQHHPLSDILKLNNTHQLPPP